MTTKNKLISALIANSIPIIGVLFWEWSAISILLAYWLENLVIGWFVLLKMRRAKKNYAVNEHNKIVPGPLRIISKAEHLTVPIIFIIHYSAFMWGHFAFLGSIAGFANESLIFNYAILLTALPFVYTHYQQYRNEYVVPKAYEIFPLSRLMFSPYYRIFVIHITIVLGAFPVIWGAKYFPQITIVLVLLKIIFDVKFQAREADLWKQFETVPTIELKK